MEKWVAKIETKGRRLEFDMRISTINLQGFKAHIFPWGKSTGNYTAISKDIKVSARFYNRDHILDYILMH